MNPFLKILQSILTILIFVSCKKDSSIPDDTNSDVKAISSPDSLVYNPDWTYLSHGMANHDYNTVFPQSSVNKIEIIMSSAQWSSICTNMKSLFGYDFGGKAGGAAGQFPGGEPDYVDVLLKFNGKSYLRQFKNDVFTESAINSMVNKYNAMITPFVIGAEGEQPGYTYINSNSAFINAVSALKTHVVNRRTLITSYVP